MLCTSSHAVAHPAKSPAHLQKVLFAKKSMNARADNEQLNGKLQGKKSRLVESVFNPHKSKISPEAV